jgi:hypothetical protein
MIDQDYVKSMECWFKEMELVKEQTKNTIKFHEKEIELHTSLLEAMQELLKWDEERMERARVNFEKYLEENK